jgi:hypothetical protein
MSEWKDKNKEKARFINQRYGMRIKSKVLTHYGNGKCSCVKCGEARLPCLSIDHINGSGTTHRREIKIIGKTFYRWLMRNDYPEGYQTLCMNCQFVKRFENYEYHPPPPLVGSQITIRVSEDTQMTLSFTEGR